MALASHQKKKGEKKLPLSNVHLLTKLYLYFLLVASRKKHIVFPLKMLIQLMAYFSWLRSKTLRSSADWL